MKLQNRVAIITGGGRGIGETLAHAYAREGAKLTLVARTLKEIQQVAEQIKKDYGAEVLALSGDVSEETAVKTIVHNTLNQYSKIDILVNGAAILGPVGRFDTNNWDAWKQTINVNLFGSLLCIKHTIPFLIKQEYGKIINFSGGGATGPWVNFSAYGASKVAIVRLSETLAEEYKAYHIDINAIAPGAVNTQFLDNILNAGEYAGKIYFQKALKQKQDGGVPPNLAAELAVFLGSSASDGLTGKLISAPWDDWKHLSKGDIKTIASSPLFSLRRIDNMFFVEKKKKS